MALIDSILIWIHLIAATFWVGGMLFLSLVAVPLLKKSPDPASSQREFVNLARRFRMFVWVALSILLVTGIILLPNVVNVSESVVNWPPAVLSKLVLVLLLIVVSLAHDRFIGPRVRTLKGKPTNQLTLVDKILLRFSPIIGRLTMILGLAILFAAVLMARS